MQGIDNFTASEAMRIKGEDPDHATRDLFEAIDQGNYPKWRFCIQVMTEAQAAEYRENPFDLTKVWKHSEFPLIDVGILELISTPLASELFLSLFPFSVSSASSAV